MVVLVVLVLVVQYSSRCLVSILGSVPCEFAIQLNLFVLLPVLVLVVLVVVVVVVVVVC